METVNFKTTCLVLKQRFLFCLRFVFWGLTQLFDFRKCPSVLMEETEQKPVDIWKTCHVSKDFAYITGKKTQDLFF